MKTLAAVLLLLSSVSRADPLPRACVKWSKDIPDAKAAGAGLFALVERVEGKGPFPGCDVVIETESFGVGWFMRAYMKEGVFTACGKRLGGYSFHYKGDQWQAKMIDGLHEYLQKNPGLAAAMKACVPQPSAVSAVPPPPPAPPAAPAQVAPPPPPVQPVVRVETSTVTAPAGIPSSPLPPAAPPGGMPGPTVISQPATAPVFSSTAPAPAPDR